MDSLMTDPALGGAAPERSSRRTHRRYPIALDLRWKVKQGHRALGSGIGKTVNLSSAGLLFDSDRELQPGLLLELSLAWPVLLRNVAPLQLRIMGEIVRAAGRRVAVRIQYHEFRTVGMVRLNECSGKRAD